MTARKPSLVTNVDRSL